MITEPGIAPHADASAESFQRPFVAATTFPFRVRGSQVRVLRSGGQPAPSATVYRLPAGQARNGPPFASGDGTPFLTGGDGYLPGRGTLNLGDRIVALWPISSTLKYTLYQTSAPTNTTGLNAFTVSAPGVQTLTVSSQRPLMLFKLSVSMEWDARNDTAFMNQLRADLRRTSELLYMWSEGQVTIGPVTISYDKQNWDSADIQIFATDRLRPNAQQGGIVRSDLTDPNASTITYEPGQIRMGAVWNRFGDVSGAIGEDWSRALAHEIGHYALFLDETDLGLDANGQLISVESCHSPMSNPYRDDYGKFRPSVGWLPSCAQTLANRATGRSEWATIKRFYDHANLDFMLRMPAAFNPSSGPGVLPLALTTIVDAPPAAAPTTIEDPLFNMETASGARYLASVGARLPVQCRRQPADRPW